MKIKLCFILLLSIICFGCGHSLTQKIGLMSLGDMEGKVIPEEIDGEILEGKDCGWNHYLSNAVRDALKDTNYDTLIDAEVTTDAGPFIFKNCITVKGKAVNSNSLKRAGGE